MGWAPPIWAVTCHVTICDGMARYYLREDKSSLLGGLLEGISPNPSNSTSHIGGYIDHILGTSSPLTSPHPQP